MGFRQESHERVEEYLEGVCEAREKELVSIFSEDKRLSETLYQKQAEIELMLTVAEYSEFHNLGGFYRNIPTIDEAVAVWK